MDDQRLVNHLDTDLDAASAPRSRSTAWPDIVGLICRLILGLTLAIAGAIKLTDLDQSRWAVLNYRIFFDTEINRTFASIVGYSLPIIEVAVGFALIAGLFTRMAAIIGTLLVLVFIGGIVSVWIRGINLDCGCFGGGGLLEATDDPRYLRHILLDAGLACTGLWLAVRPQSSFALDARLFPNLEDGFSDSTS